MTSPWFYQNKTRRNHGYPPLNQWTGMKLVHSVYALPANRLTHHCIDSSLDLLGYHSFKRLDKR